jgi:hypothetical protein
LRRSRFSSTILDRLLDWLLLLGRTSSSEDVELLVLRHEPIAEVTGRHDQIPRSPDGSIVDLPYP